MATQKEIADQLKLSVGTVSRALRNDPSIRASTRGRVIEAAGRLGYCNRSRPAQGRASNVGGQSTTIGVLLRYMDGEVAPGHARMLAGMSEVTGDYNITLAVHYVRDHELDELVDPVSCPTLLRRNDVEGLILLNAFPSSAIERLSERWPCVSLTHAYYGLNIDSVHVDPTTGMVELVDHLYALGHRRIGFITDSRGLSWSHARHAGYVEGLRRLGLTPDPADTLNAPDHADDGSQVRAITDRIATGVTAWMLANDRLADRVIGPLGERRFHVPRRISLTGFDRDPLYSVGEMALTTIETPFEELGAAAARIMRNRLEHPFDRSQRLLLRGNFVKGESTAPPEV